MSSYRFMLRFAVLFVALSGFGTLSTAFAENKPDHVVAKVDGADITEADVTMALADLGDSIQQIPEAQRHDYAITYLVDIRLGAKAAR